MKELLIIIILTKDFLIFNKNYIAYIFFIKNSNLIEFYLKPHTASTLIFFINLIIIYKLVKLKNICFF